MKEIDLIVPIYNENKSVVLETINHLKEVTSSNTMSVNILIVNDGSDEKYETDSLSDEEGITYLCHDKNRGYGSALKTGILKGSSPLIAIIDADGTYPPDALPQLIQQMTDMDMVIGTRVTKVREIPLLP